MCCYHECIASFQLLTFLNDPVLTPVLEVSSHNGFQAKQ